MVCHGAGFVLGTAPIAMGSVGLAQGVSVGTALAVAAFGVSFLLCALWYLRWMMTRRRALAEFASARVELPGAIDQARARLDEQIAHDERDEHR